MSCRSRVRPWLNSSMRTVELNYGNKFTIRESSKELPANRFTDFQKYVIQDVGIGSDMPSVDKHFRNLDTFISAGKVEEAATERYNLHYNLFLAINSISIRHISFGVLIDSINDKPLRDYSEKSLLELLKKLGRWGLKEEQVADILESVKKNLILN